MMNGLLKGVDISTMQELSRLKVKYYDDGQEKDVVDILSGYGVNSVRLRLWNSPYNSDTIPYGGGTNDLITTIEIARRCKAAGMSFLLDFHYSDFWADATKQLKPKAWKNYSFDELCAAIKRYSASVIEYLNAAGVCPDMVQPGNEIVNGLLWPEGKAPNYERMAKLLKAAISGIKAASTDIKIILHLAVEPEHSIYGDFLDTYGRELDYDGIGVSYYPYKNNFGLDTLKGNMQTISEKYGKDIYLLETAMAYTTEDYGKLEKLNDHARKGMAARVRDVEFPATKEGQADYLKKLLENISEIEKCRGFYYWEPDWIPVVGSGWATSASLQYLGVAEPCGNEWANQALFDYEGNALPALKVIKEF